MKKIDTLIEDMQAVFTDPEHEVSEENLKKMGEGIAACVKKAVEECSKPRQRFLRLSKLGTPNRKLWYEFNYHTDEEIEEMGGLDPTLAMKFLYGHIMEEVLLFFIRESGHVVEDEQGEVDIEGIPGHKDCKIDGHTIDIKTASKYGFEKFRDGSVVTNDPFGYIAQLSAYKNGEEKQAGFLAINKESGEVCLTMIDDMDLVNAPARAQEVKEVVESPTPPVEKCYPDQPMGKSGNRTLHNNCTYCPFKLDCWKDANNGTGLRGYQYSNGIKYLTQVGNEPRVPLVDLYNEEGL